MTSISMGVPLLLLMLACATTGSSAGSFTLEVVSTRAVASFDSLPEPRVTVANGAITVEAVFPLGGAGYRLTPHGSIVDGVIDLLVAAARPEDVMGATVLTVYGYRLRSGTIAPGSYTVRLHHALADEGDPEFILEQPVVIPR